MNVFRFIFYLGIIHVIFGFVWKWVVALPFAFIVTLIHFPQGMKLLKIFGSYLLVSLTALFTLVAIGQDPSWLKLVGYPLIGVFILYMAYASNYYEARKEASSTQDYSTMAQLNKDAGFEVILTLGVLLLYVITLFLPLIANNGLNEWVFHVVGWAYDLPVIGWIIGIGGIIFLLSTIYRGLFTFGLVIASISNLFKKKSSIQLE